MSTPSHEAELHHSLGPKLPYAMGRFTLCRELGAGGMATVYLSKMRLAAGLERLVALKTIHGHLAKEQTFVDMFLDEAKIASHISHPNVCSVYDFGDVGGVYYMAMEYLVGEPLFDFVNAIAEDDGQELREAQPYLAARIIADACEGLHAAHTLRGADGKALHVVHRDVSPQNLFVTYEGAVKVVDFGCAKALERVTQTNTGIMKGKVSYAAPEQLKQESDVDARADVWALGVCLWEALTLEQLFRRENAIQTAMAVLEDRIPRADEGRDWVPSKLADIAAKALARDASERYPDARAMGKALRGFIARSGVPFESAEVAEWMRYLFPQRHRRVQEVVSEVEKMEVSQVGPVLPPADAVDEAPGDDEREGRAIADAPTKLAKTVSSARRELRDPEAYDDEPVVLPTSTKRWVWSIAVLVLLAAGGAFAYTQYRAPIDAALGIGMPAEAVTPTDGSGAAGEGAPEPTAGAVGEGEGARDEGAAGEGAEGEGAAGEGAEGEGAEGEGAEGDGDESVEGGGDEGAAAASGDDAERDGA
ncbi:MAG TPA: serine/threonine-protein kinase, partial [Sandaracinaceae bacterium LLY-WYZ-13_1]|nr:serine/threonine-protein kinase [Sandaracinaceae bacterium LLY-WYZ-13_1]